MTVPTVIDRTGETYKNNRRTTVTNKFVTSQRGPCPRHPFPYPPQGCRRAASMYRAGQAGTRVSATVQDLYPPLPKQDLMSHTAKKNPKNIPVKSRALDHGFGAHRWLYRGDWVDHADQAGNGGRYQGRGIGEGKFGRPAFPAPRSCVDAWPLAPPVHLLCSVLPACVRAAAVWAIRHRRAADMLRLLPGRRGRRGRRAEGSWSKAKYKRSTGTT